MDIVYQEVPSYKTLLLRRSSRAKIMETVIFLLFIIILGSTYGYHHPFFKILAIGSAIITIALSPLFYKLIVNPKYVLTKTGIIITKFNKENLITFNNITPSYDLRYFFFINGKKTALSVSDQFLEALKHQLEYFKRKK